MIVYVFFIFNFFWLKWKDKKKKKKRNKVYCFIKFDKVCKMIEFGVLSNIFFLV